VTRSVLCRQRHASSSRPLDQCTGVALRKRVVRLANTGPEVTGVSTASDKPVQQAQRHDSHRAARQDHFVPGGASEGPPPEPGTPRSKRPLTKRNMGWSHSSKDGWDQPVCAGDDRVSQRRPVLQSRLSMTTPLGPHWVGSASRPSSSGDILTQGLLESSEALLDHIEVREVVGGQGFLGHPDATDGDVSGGGRGRN
jgi:hypothetical protein